MPAQTVLPRWRGFNLSSMTSAARFQPLLETDFAWIAELGFDFVRIPLSWWNWTDPNRPYDLMEDKLAHVDQAVLWGEKYGLHVNLNFHRSPGYCCMPEPADPWSLWKSPDAQAVFYHHWVTFAKRYRASKAVELSFNLVNEAPPPDDALAKPQTLPMQSCSRAEHEQVMRTAVAAIRAVSPDRPIIIDGMWYGRGLPSFELADLGVAQSTRAYTPMGLSHWRAPWWREGGMDWPKPTWPGGLEADKLAWSREALETHYRPWAELAQQGVGVHCGEGGCYINTPHEVFLAWFEDVLDILRGHNIGWAVWNFRGDFGILDSGRADVTYEDWRGHQLDRRFLNLLQRY